MLECLNLSTAHDGIPVLENVTFQLHPGQLTAVLGKNGVGKSTLFNCLQQMQPFSGNILLNGTNIANYTPRELAQRIAYLPQFLPCPDVTVEELVSFGRNPYLGINRTFSSIDTEAIHNALDLADIKDLRYRILSTLSGGERQRAYLAMVLAQSTEILILDEPTTSMDIVSAAAFLTLLKALTDLGKSVMIIIHDLSLAVRFSDQIIILDDHQCVFAGTKDDCLRQHMIENVFKVRRLSIADGNENNVVFTA